MTFADLTWEDLKEWAGSKVVARGKSYRRAVEDLRMTADGRLLAWVEGGDRYATVVSLDKSGKLLSVCTCPYAIACKHAVAMVLTYLDAVQAKESIPAVEDGDERLELLAAAQDAGDMDEDEAEILPVVPRKQRGKRSSAEAPEDVPRRYLASLSNTALLDFVQQLANDFPEVRQFITDRAELQSGDVAKLMASTRREIVKVSAEPGWTRHWSNERHIPDYSRVQERLKSLLESGHADEVVALGDDLLRRGLQQVGMSNDEGETGQEVAGCMAIVFRALKSSSKTGAELLLWEIDARLSDGYSILDGLHGPLEDRKAFTPADWSAVADNLARRMEDIRVAAEESDPDGGRRRYVRQAVMRWLLDALRQAGREREMAAILVREAELTHCYVELVDHLLSARQKDSAEEWARKGFERTVETLPGIAWALEERLRDLAARKKDQPLVAAFRAMEFFERPDVERYAAVQKAARPLGLWDTIRPMLSGWLETGTRPDLQTAVSMGPRGRRRPSEPPLTPPQEWLLPPTGLLVPGEKGRYRFFPDTATLIAIAIHEHRNDDVLRWYNHAGKEGRGWQDYQGETVAAAVQETHPDDALAIWKRNAKAQIAMTNLAAYRMAGACLVKMRAVYERTGRLVEWERLLAELRTENARKPRMIEVLDGLEGKRSRILKA